MAAAARTKLEAPLVGGKDKVALSEDVFSVEANGSLLHEAVKAEQAHRRQGTHSAKSRGEVAGGAGKPWRQKGTGRARQGTIRAPQWTGGGVVFAKKPVDHSVKINKKAARKARNMALSQHAAGGSLGVFDATTFDAPATKDAVALLKPWRSERPCLVVLAPEEDNAALSFRILDRTHVISVSELEVCEILWARTLLVSRAALQTLSGGEG
jgi:large subunit ribosomal protein L4